MTRTMTRGDHQSSSIAGSVRGAVTRDRLLFAAKTALAVGIAWMIAHLLPGVVDDLPYYAPLGALISMHPTLMDSVKSSVQTLAGLAAGIVLALVVVFTAGPTVWTLALVAGVGVLLSGTGWFGAGREYIAVAAVFVLIIGGSDAEAYSLSYLAQMAVGLAVGLGVNLVLAPGPFSATAKARVAEYQRDLADHLAGIGDALAESWPPARTEWTRGADALESTARDVRSALAEADRSRRGNPRARGGRHDTETAHARLETLESVAVRVRDISDALEDVVRERATAFPLDPDLIPVIGRACQATAGAIAVIGSEDRHAHRARAAAAHDVRLLVDALDAGQASARSILGPGVLVATHLRRIIVLLHVVPGKE
jgi:hypothetical protein